MYEQHWIDVLRPSLLGKCGFGMYEKGGLQLCGSCSVTYYDYCDLSSSFDCCAEAAGETETRGRTGGVTALSSSLDA